MIQPSPKRSSHFFALRPEGGATGELATLRDAPRFGGSPVRNEHLHVTLFWLGYDHAGTPALITRARDAAETVKASSIRVVFDKLVAAKSNLLLLPDNPMEHLNSFQQQLALALAAQGVRADHQWRFSPHVTLRRGPPGGSVRAIDPTAWTATEFVLIQSLVDPFRYETVETWPLGC